MNRIVPMEVALIDHMGSDLTIVNAARVSFAKESTWNFKGYFDDDGNEAVELNKGDVGLINYLATHNHWTPFGHCFVQFRIKAPIFVARQLVKHQVGLVWNEVSRRYVDTPPEYYLPDTWRARPEGSVKQGSGDTHPDTVEFSAEMPEVIAAFDELYLGLIEKGVAPEQARMVLPQNTMTEWYWSGSLAAFSRVCKLRLDPHTQAETTDIAQGINELIAPLFPVAWAALQA